MILEILYSAFFGTLIVLCMLGTAVCVVGGLTLFALALRGRIPSRAAPPIIIPLRRPPPGQNFGLEESLRSVMNAAARWQNLLVPFPEMDLIPGLKQYGESAFEHAQAEIEDELINQGELPMNYGETP